MLQLLFVPTGRSRDGISPVYSRMQARRNGAEDKTPESAPMPALIAENQ